MKVCYWNVCNASKPEYIVSSCEQLVRQGVGILCLQELPYVRPGYTPLSQQIMQELDLEGRFVHTRTLPSLSRLKGYGTAILTNLGLINLSATYLGNKRPLPMAVQHPRGHTRMMLEASVEDKPDIDVAVAHLSYKLPFGIGNVAMLNERQILVKTLRERTKQAAVLFGGDLNCRPQGGLDDHLANIGLNLVTRATEPTFRSRHWYAGYTERNLDRIFASSELQATAEIGDFQQSDHRPVIVEV